MHPSASIVPPSTAPTIVEMHTDPATADFPYLGDIDSAILVGDALRSGCIVYPLYVRNGLFWESVELDYLRRFLDALGTPNLLPLHILELPVTDLYPSHWSLTGRNVPDADTPDQAVFLPGRNVLLLAKAILWCHLHHVPAVAMAPLAG